MKQIADMIRSSIEVKQKLLASDLSLIAKIAERCVDSFKSGNQVLFCGNGGSASDAQHLSAELSGRYLIDRPPLNSEALHVNTSYLTAVANDYSYDVIFSRLVEAKCKKGDVLFGLSTSGNSKNVVKAFEVARKLGVFTVAFTGEKPGKIDSLSDFLLKIPSSDTPRIQESHIMVGHIICHLIEEKLFQHLA